MRRLAGAWVRLRRRVGLGLEWRARDSECPWLRFELSWVRNSDDRPGNGTPCVALHTANGPLQLSGFALVHLGSGIALDPHWPTAALQDMARLAYSRLDSELSAALGGDAECRAEADGVALVEGVDLLLTLVGRCGERHCFGLRAAAATALRWLEHERWRPRPSDAMPHLLADLPCRGRLWLGSTCLAQRELSSLRPGDAIRIEHCHLDANGRGRIKLGPLHLDVSAAPDGAGAVLFQSWGVPFMHDDSIEFSAGDNENLAPSAAMDELQISLDFTAGRTQMSLGQLRALAVGDAIQLGLAARPAVNILANGRCIGSGELVDVDGALAVEVLSLTLT
ncbi:type III secretion system cytoplasmic ring protein SctQ [Duganella violaceipulchra]|uniref:Type III secretion protein Q n=1 Tax=Duganella violaceipulchra TaxID=2849652 RepID=A0AA41L0C0_9BURK|nr:type III secretion system cytoplasmic ring protein SctQ [Duganella violaceicalia]MBV6322451.1 type III secretion system cytoplasmic ring protein SctQ [Duganella violaceicalia]MCP2010656.1 type III secretion protein Q [Duganella violaceicalia]